MKRVNFSIPWPLTAGESRDLLQYLFQLALVSYLGFYLIENLKPGFVSDYFNLNIVLYVTIISGILASLWPAIAPAAREHRTGWKHYLGLLLVAVLAAIFVWYKIQTLGPWAKLIAPVSGLIVFGLGASLYLDAGDEQQ